MSQTILSFFQARSPRNRTAPRPEAEPPIEVPPEDAALVKVTGVRRHATSLTATARGRERELAEAVDPVLVDAVGRLASKVLQSMDGGREDARALARQVISVTGHTPQRFLRTLEANGVYDLAWNTLEGTSGHSLARDEAKQIVEFMHLLEHPEAAAAFKQGRLHIQEKRPESPLARTLGIARATDDLFARERLIQHSGAEPITLVLADLITIERSPARYEYGEIAHVENVMAAEIRKREHTDITRTEIIRLDEEEVEETEEHDLQTTDRFELEKEMERTMRQELSLQVGASVSGTYGFVSFSADANFGFSMGSSSSTTEAQRFAKEVAEKTANRVTRRVRSVRETRMMRELVERNAHEFDNSAGEEARVGIYRWLDKVYGMQLKNHGPRLLVDLMVPDPGAVLRQARNGEDAPPTSIVPSPESLKIHPGNLVTTYQKAVEAYGIAISAPPKGRRESAPSIATVTQNATATQIASIPADFQAKKWELDLTVVTFNRDYVPYVHDWNIFSVTVTWAGNSVVLTKADGKLNVNSKTHGTASKDVTTSPLTGSVQFTTVGSATLEYTLSVSYEIEPTAAALQAWEDEAWAKIVAAYQAALDAERAAASLTAEPASAPAFESNPTKNRSLVFEELKRLSIATLTRTHLDFPRPTDSTIQPAKFDHVAAQLLGESVRFVEQAFEWRQLAFVLYPYFWAQRGDWLSRLRMSDPDFEFEQFLKAGYARVVVAIRPGFEQAVMHWFDRGVALELGWDFSDPYYVSIGEELSQMRGGTTAADEGPPFEILLPTTLVQLQGTTDPNVTTP